MSAQVSGKQARPSRPSGWGWDQLRSVGHAGIHWLPPRPRCAVFHEMNVKTTILHEEAEECDDTRVFLPGQPESTRIVAEAAQELQDGTLIFEDLTAGMHRDDKARDYHGDGKDKSAAAHTPKTTQHKRAQH